MKMKNRLISCVLVVCVLICCILSSCKSTSKTNKYSAHSLDYFDTATTITGYAATKQEFDAVVDEVFEKLSEYHKLYTIYHRFDGLENLCTINELVDGEHRVVKVDRRIIDMLLYAKQMYNDTDGMLNIAMGSVLSLWHDYRTIGRDDPSQASLPPKEQLTEAARHIDITKMVIDEEKCTVTLTDPLMKLDVGAVAKGYATERIALELEEKGITGYVLNIGGNIRTIGSKPDGEPWVVGIEDGRGGDYLELLQLRGESVVTSGSYQRYYTVDGKRYHHIIHPETQMPAEGYLSVSVVCNDSALGDCLSTALFCMSLEKGRALVESMPNVEAIWVKENGEEIISSGWKKYIKQ